jgi:hypothetical protein
MKSGFQKYSPQMESGWANIRQILLPDQDLRFLQPPWIYCVSGEQLSEMALCNSQPLAASSRGAHFELGFPNQFSFFRFLASNHVYSLYQFHLNQIQD